MKTILLIFSLLCICKPASGQGLPFSDDFNDGNYVGWQVIDDREPQSGPSNWQVENGELVQKSNIWSFGPVELETKYHLGTHIVRGLTSWTDYAMNAIVRSTDNDGVGLIFRYQDPLNYYRVLLMNDPSWSGLDSSGTAVNTPLQRIQKFVDGEPVILAENKVSNAYPPGYFSLTADVRGDTIRAFLNGNLILTAIDATYSSGKIGMLSYANSGAYYDDISITEEPLIYPAPEREVTYAVREDRMPYIQNPTQVSVEVAWRTLEETVGSVQYDSEKGRLGNEITEPEARQKHHVRITNLDPSTRYFYKVLNDGVSMTDETDFRTARTNAEDVFSFLVLGDSGVDTPTQWKLGEAMRANMNAAEVDFMVHVGDVHQGQGDYYDNIYFKPYRTIIQNINVYTSLGNHDTYTDNGEVYLDDFYLPHNNADSTERYYSFRWANAYFICLDTNIDYSPGSPQYQFFLNALQDPLRESATWTFVYAHHPPYTEYWTDYYGDEGVQNHLVPLFESYDVDMVMNGHTHSYERGEKEHVHYLVTGGGGGNLDTYFIDYDHITFSDAVHHFTRIDVNDDQLTVSAIDENSNQIDRFLVNKQVEITSIDDPALPRQSTLLEPVFPNPVRASVTIPYSVATANPVHITVFDVSGKKVADLVDHVHQPGHYEIVYSPVHLPNGTYVVQMKAGNETFSRPLTLVK